MEYLKLAPARCVAVGWGMLPFTGKLNIFIYLIEVVPAYSNIMKPIILTSGCILIPARFELRGLDGLYLYIIKFIQ